MTAIDDVLECVEPPDGEARRGRLRRGGGAARGEGLARATPRRNDDVVSDKSRGGFCVREDAAAKAPAADWGPFRYRASGTEPRARVRQASESLAATTAALGPRRGRRGDGRGERRRGVARGVTRRRRRRAEPAPPLLVRRETLLQRWAVSLAARCHGRRARRRRRAAGARRSARRRHARGWSVGARGVREQRRSDDAASATERSPSDQRAQLAGVVEKLEAREADVKSREGLCSKPGAPSPSMHEFLCRIHRRGGRATPTRLDSPKRARRSMPRTRSAGAADGAFDAPLETRKRHAANCDDIEDRRDAPCPPSRARGGGRGGTQRTPPRPPRSVSIRSRATPRRARRRASPRRQGAWSPPRIGAKRRVADAREQADALAATAVDARRGGLHGCREASAQSRGG